MDQIRPIIVDFTGSHSTGKTTAIDFVRGMVKLFNEDNAGRVHFTCNAVSSISRTYLEEQKLKIYGDVDDFSQAWITFGNISNILESVRNYDITLCTDLAIRNLAYTLSSPHAGDATARFHVNMLLHFQSPLFTSQVDLYRFYLPVEFPVVPDGVRHENEVYRKDVDDRIKRILEDYEVSHTVLTGSESMRNVCLNVFINSLIANRVFMLGR